jgi:hypothetical protein
MGKVFSKPHWYFHQPLQETNWRHTCSKNCQFSFKIMIIRNNSFAPVPMGFCYSGKGVSDDLPPRPECAPLWHQQVLSKMKQVKLVIFIRQHTHKYYLCEKSKPTLTGNVKTIKNICINIHHLFIHHQVTEFGKRKMLGLKKK